MDSRRSDAELMEALRDRGEPEAFALLATRWRPRLTAWFAPLLGEPAATDDAVQEVLLRLWTSRADYRCTGRFDAYVLTLARHHWLNLNRLRRRRETEELDDEQPGGERGPEALVVARETASRLAAATAALPAGQREVFALVVEQQLGQADVARRLDLPLGTIKSRLHSARVRLARVLEEHDHA